MSGDLYRGSVELVVIEGIVVSVTSSVVEDAGDWGQLSWVGLAMLSWVVICAGTTVLNGWTGSRSGWGTIGVDLFAV